jgi:hypothetical protein
MLRINWMALFFAPWLDVFVHWDGKYAALEIAKWASSRAIFSL